MNYFEMPTEKLETLKATIEEKLDAYIGMTFASTRSELVSYEIDSVYYDEVLLAANHDYKGLIRGYTVTIDGGVDDDVEYNIYNADEEITDGGYMSFHRLPKDVQNAVIDIYELYRELETINNILNARAEEEPEEEPEEGSISEVLGFSGFDYEDAKSKLENDLELNDLFEEIKNILDTYTYGEETEEEEEEEEEV